MLDIIWKEKHRDWQTSLDTGKLYLTEQKTSDTRWRERKREKEKERASAVKPGGSDNEVLAATFTAFVHASTKAT